MKIYEIGRSGREPFLSMATPRPEQIIAGIAGGGALPPGDYWVREYTFAGDQRSDGIDWGIVTVWTDRRWQAVTPDRVLGPGYSVEIRELGPGRQM